MTRLAIGQPLGRLLRHLRAELFEPAADGGYPDLQVPHLQIFGNLGIDGIRLTELAARAQLSLAAASELVNDLQKLGYVERRPDATDGRAKLIFPTTRGRAALDDACHRVAEIEQHWSQIVGAARFAGTCRTCRNCSTPSVADPARHRRPGGGVGRVCGAVSLVVSGVAAGTCMDPAPRPGAGRRTLTSGVRPGLLAGALAGLRP